MNITDDLKQEHRKIESMLAVIKRMCTCLESGEPVDTDHLSAAVEWIRGFADCWHHTEEEELLFPELEKAGIPAAGGPIGCMLEEHEQGRALVRRMGDAAGRVRNGDAEGAAADFCRAAREYIALLESHIQKEDQILYYMADMRLLPAQQESLMQARAEAEARVGRDELNHFDAMLNHLREVFAAEA